ncbi:hypothetical protein HK405_013608, partial [Cladochytrium tenue]
MPSCSSSSSSPTLSPLLDSSQESGASEHALLLPMVLAALASAAASATTVVSHPPSPATPIPQPTFATTPAHTSLPRPRPAIGSTASAPSTPASPGSPALGGPGGDGLEIPWVVRPGHGRMYVCPHDGCGLEARRRFNVVTHLRTHLAGSQRPRSAVCDVCGRGYLRPYELARHKQR